MTEKFRDRLVWPDPGVPATDRARTMALAYRETALALQAEADAVRKALAGVDLRVLKFADPQAAKAVKALLGDTATDPVTALDDRFSEWGEQWHADPPDFVFDEDDWVPTQIAIHIVGINNNTLGDHRSKGAIRGRFVKRGSNATFLYRVGDLRALRERLMKPKHGGRRPAVPVKYQ